MMRDTGLIDWENPVSSHPLNRGLVAWYLAGFNQTGFRSLFWKDLCGRNHGTLTNMDPVTDWVASSHPGGFGALDFDGTNDEVTINPNLVTSGAMTLQCWVALDKTDVVGYLISKMGLSGNRGPLLSVEGNQFVSTSKFTFGVAENSTTRHFVSTETSIYPISMQWVHVAGVYTPSQNLRIYVDGVDRTASSVAGPASQYTNNGKSWYLGNRPDDPGHMKGRLADVRIYFRDLSAFEISALYRQSLLSYPDLLNRIDSRFYSFPVGGATPWYYTRQPSRILGCGIGV